MTFPALPICFLIPLLMDTSAGLVWMATQILLKIDYGFSDAQAGVILGAATVVYTIFSFIGGLSADKWGPLSAIKTGLIIVALNAAAFLFGRSTGMFVILTISLALGHAFFWPAFQSWLGHGANRAETARRLGFFSMGWSLGLSGLGPLFAGWALEVDHRLPFALAALLPLCLLIFFQIFKPEIRSSMTGDSAFHEEVPDRETRRRFLAVARIANLAAVIAMVTLQTYLPLFSIDWNLSESAIGNLIAVLGVSQSISFLGLTLFSGWHYRFRFMVLGQTLGVLGLLCFGVLGTFLVVGGGSQAAWFGIGLSIPALVLTGMMCGVSFYSSSFYSIFGEEKKGRNSGIHEAIIGSSNVIAKFGGAAVILAFGKMGPYNACGLVILGALALELGVFRGKLRQFRTKVAPPV